MGKKDLKPISVPLDSLHPVPGFPGYFVTKDGKVFSVKELAPMKHSDGYMRVCLYGKSRGKKRKGIHQILALTFLMQSGGEEVRHIDGNKLNNSLSNLAWGTRAENAADMIVHGTSLRGEKNPKALISERQAIRIREEFNAGKTVLELSDKYKMTWYAIRRLLQGGNWKHLGKRPPKKYKRGYFHKGKPAKKLNTQKVLQLRRDATFMTREKLARKYKLSFEHIRNIINRKAWARV